VYGLVLSQDHALAVPPRRPLALALASPLGLPPLSLEVPRPALALAFVPRPPRPLTVLDCREVDAGRIVCGGGFSTNESVVLIYISKAGEVVWVTHKNVWS
jgi:hypothetical protein